MHRRPSNLPVLFGLIVSVLVHAAAILPLLLLVMTSTATPLHMAARFDPSDFAQDPEEPPPPEHPETQLGLDADTPSTLTWVGYREYKEHLAALAETEQAAFKTAPAGAMPAPSEAQPEPAPPPPPPAPPPDADATDEAAAAATQQAAVTALESEDRMVALRAWAERLAIESEPLPDDADAAATSADDALDDLITRLFEAAAEADRPETPSPPDTPPETPPRTSTGEAAPKPPETEPKPSDRPAPPAPEPADQPSDPGAVSDRESPATSIIEVPFDQLKLGQPLAQPGLELKPQRPRFTTLTQLSASPGNPLVVIRFGADGKPREGTKILLSSGNSAVDHSLEASLFRWRARGKQLEDLGPGETLDVRLRIILNPRAR